MFQGIPPHRLVIYIMICGAFPLLAVLFHFFSKLEQLDNLKLHMEQVNASVFTRERQQATNMAVQSVYREAEHFYIDKHIESIPLLQPEIDSLKTIASNPNFTEDEAIKKRLEFLTGTANSLVFSEGVVQSTPHFQEVTETLVHPIEVNNEDLKNILAKIEGKELGAYAPGPGRPQLIILDFKLERKNITEKNEVFLLNLKILKREFL